MPEYATQHTHYSKVGDISMLNNQNNYNVWIMLLQYTHPTLDICK